MAARKGYGGKTVYGARVGILMLDTKWPRPPGDTGNALTWPFPVLYKVVKGASARVVIHEKGKGLGPAFLDAAAELVREGADGITTTGGFLAIFQKQLADHVRVPVASSSLLQIPIVQRLLPPGKRVGVLSVHGDRITTEHWDAVGAPHDTPVMGTEGGREFTRVMLNDEIDMDYDLAEQDILEAGEKLLERHPDVGAIVTENHNMGPYAAALNRRLRIPIYTVYTLVTWFQAGLAPRDFGYPGSSGPDVWRER
ncbi:MAG TPA: aspartate/glutamate racemase family protein [Burkholderiales bacterium]|nr:aspartate/glutamate racemase family protein [Burkholderiales bacterium]